MTVDGRVAATLQFIQNDNRRLHAHSKAALLTIDWMLRCARRHSPLMGRVMQAHFKVHFSRHRLRIERDETLARRKHHELLRFIRKIVRLSSIAIEQTKSVLHSLNQVISENETKHGQRHRARDGNALVRLRAENAVLVTENMALLGELTLLRAR